MMFPAITQRHDPLSLHLQPPLHHQHPPPKYHLPPPENHHILPENHIFSPENLHLPPVIEQKTPSVFVFNISAKNKELFAIQAKKYEFEVVPVTLPLPSDNKQKMKNINTPIFVFNISDENIVFFHTQIKKYEEEKAHVF